MRVVLSLYALTLLIACKNHTADESQLKNTIDSLKKELASTYKPGFGEFMSGIQSHHAKLWFAGTSQNWELADFEIHEIKENMEGIQKFCRDREETRSLDMINPAMDSVSLAVQQKDMNLFRAGFLLLTNTCNTCHRATAHAFNVVTVPSGPAFVNQDFKPAK